MLLSFIYSRHIFTSFYVRILATENASVALPMVLYKYAYDMI